MASVVIRIRAAIQRAHGLVWVSETGVLHRMVWRSSGRWSKRGRSRVGGCDAAKLACIAAELRFKLKKNGVRDSLVRKPAVHRLARRERSALGEFVNRRAAKAQVEVGA